MLNQITITHWILLLFYMHTAQNENEPFFYWEWNEKRSKKICTSLELNESMKQTNRKKTKPSTYMQVINIFLFVVFIFAAFWIGLNTRTHSLRNGTTISVHSRPIQITIPNVLGIGVVVVGVAHILCRWNLLGFRCACTKSFMCHCYFAVRVWDRFTRMRVPLTV